MFCSCVSTANLLLLVLQLVWEFWVVIKLILRVVFSRRWHRGEEINGWKTPFSHSGFALSTVYVWSAALEIMLLNYSLFKDGLYVYYTTGIALGGHVNVLMMWPTRYWRYYFGVGVVLNIHHLKILKHLSGLFSQSTCTVLCSETWWEFVIVGPFPEQDWHT